MAGNASPGGVGGAGGGTSGASGPSFGVPGAKESNSADAAAQGVSVSAVRRDPYGETPPAQAQPGQASSPSDQWRRSPAGANVGGHAGRGSSHRPVRSLASTRGRNWGLRDTGGAIPITRPIRIECHPDRLVVAPGRGGTSGKTIPFGTQTVSAVDEMVFDAWEHVETWGIAGDGMYWRPTR